MHEPYLSLWGEHLIERQGDRRATNWDTFAWSCSSEVSRPAAGAGNKAQRAGILGGSGRQLSFMTTKCLPFSLSNLQCSRVSRWLVGTKMLQVTQNRSGILLTDACGICLANLLLLRWTRLLLNVCSLLQVYDDGEVYIGVCRTGSALVTVWVYQCLY